VPAFESVKKLTEKATGWSRPKKTGLDDLVRPRKPHLVRFKDDGVIPNHPTFPLIVYRGAVGLPKQFDPAAVFEDLFEKNGWGDSWRNGIYDYVHYHSRIHEVLGIARGSGKVQFGGKRGRTLALKAGDVAILPAGTGHQCLSASKDFLVALHRSGARFSGASANAASTRARYRPSRAPAALAFLGSTACVD
jgi:uncharacterized protein YjlB